MGARSLALSFSHLDSQIDAIGLSDHVFFLRDQPQSAETGQTELVSRVNFLEGQSWIKKAKPRDEVYCFFLEISSNRVVFDPCPYPIPTIWFQTTILSTIPRSHPQLLSILIRTWVALSHSHPCARPHTHHHTLLVTQSQPGLILWARG